MHDRPDDHLAPITAPPTMDELQQQRDHILISARLTAETQQLRATEPRADTKAGQLQQLCSGLLLAGLALLSTGKLPGPAAACGATAAGLLIIAVVLLSAATRPHLGGNFGFVRWARTGTDRDVLDALAATSGTDDGQLEQARQLRWLSRSLYAKFARIRLAQTLLVAAFALAAAAAALTAWTR
jgi:hypothetical protein